MKEAAGFGSSFLAGAFYVRNELLSVAGFKAPMLGFFVMVSGLLGSLNFLERSSFTVLVSDLVTGLTVVCDGFGTSVLVAGVGLA